MKIGIFWYYQYQVLGIARHINFNNADSLGLIDSPYTHVKYWETIKKENMQLIDLEYDDIPRGRIVYNKITDSFIIYLDSKLLTKPIVNMVMTFFELNNAKIGIKKDAHYYTK